MVLMKWKLVCMFRYSVLLCSGCFRLSSIILLVDVWCMSVVRLVVNVVVFMLGCVFNMVSMWLWWVGLVDVCFVSRWCIMCIVLVGVLFILMKFLIFVCKVVSIVWLLVVELIVISGKFGNKCVSCVISCVVLLMVLVFLLSFWL